MYQQRKSTRKKRQTQLSFTPLPSSSPAASQYPEQIQQRAASVRYDHTISTPTKKRRIGGAASVGSPFSPASSNGGSPLRSQKFQVVVPSPKQSSDQLPTPAASSQVEVDYTEIEKGNAPSDDLHKQNPHMNSTLPAANAKITAEDSGRLYPDSTSEEDDDLPVRSARRTRPVPVLLSSNDSSQVQRPRNITTPTKSSRLLPKDTELGGSPNKTDSEAPTGKLRQKLAISPNSRRNTNVSTTKKTRPSEARKAKETLEPIVISDRSEDSSSEDVMATPVRKRRSIAQVQPPTRDSDHEDEAECSDDLQGELEDLQEAGTPLRSNRTRNGAFVSERSKRQQKLEELRRRRAGIREESEEEDEQEEQEEIELNEETDLSEPDPIHHAMRRGGNLDEYEDDFVDDEDDKMGVDLGVAGVPLEFTYHANKKPFEHFKTEIEWMVHNKLNPAFDRYDEMYELAHRKLDKEVEGFAGSKFSSSVWGEEFSKALKARPDLSRVDVPTMLEHKCDACRRSGHPPKHKITFSGKPYNRDTLETIEYDEDEDEDTEDSDDDGSSSTKEEDSFFLGRFCCANAEMAHALHHWRYALNQTVLAWLAAEGHLAPAKIVERENLRQKKRQKAAHKIVDDMEDTGVMKMLYKQFKENLAAARDAKPERFSGR